MNFQLTEEQELIRRNAREFAERHVAPVAAAVDEKAFHPRELFAELGAGGWLGIPLPERYGGSGADLLTHAVVVEEISRACSATGFTLSFHAGIIGMSLAHLRQRRTEESNTSFPWQRGSTWAPFP